MTEFEYWWLLGFAVFFGLGWLAARIDIRHLLSESRALPESYFRGLNFLLKNQPDKAVEALLEASRLDPQAIELQFSLGGLFRRRGEIVRAIHIHQDLLEREDIGEASRVDALFELACDYQKAGLLDRAEEMFLRLNVTGRADDARRELVAIYEQERDWLRLVDMMQGAGEAGSRLAHYYCELAARSGGGEKASALLRKALAADPFHVRACIMLGDLALQEGEEAQAIRWWSMVAKERADYLSLVAGRLAQAWLSTGQAAEGLALLLPHARRQPAGELLDAAWLLAKAVSGEEAASELLVNVVCEAPSLSGLSLALSGDRSDPRIVSLMRELVHRRLAENSVFRCSRCGFGARSHYWRCPTCGAWDSFPSVRDDNYPCPSQTNPAMVMQ